jgi:small-conductance mechanosensitive channel
MGDHSGKVIRLTSRDTVLMTYDGNHLRIPNSVIITSALTNYSRNPLRRFDFAVGVSTNLDLVEVRRLGLETLGSLSSVLDDPGPNILIEELGDSTVNMRFFGWVDQRENDFAKSKSEAIRLVKVAFDDADIEMPEPIYRVHLQEAGAVAAKETEEPVTRIDFEEDLSVDDTIDKQVAAVRSAEDEDNLLSEEEG